MDVDTAELLFLRDSSGVYNSSAIAQLINSYTTDERRLLFDNLNVPPIHAN